jgi:hypothetical protein
MAEASDCGTRLPDPTSVRWSPARSATLSNGRGVVEFEYPPSYIPSSIRSNRARPTDPDVLAFASLPSSYGRATVVLTRAFDSSSVNRN